MTKDEALSAKHEGATTVALKLALEALGHFEKAGLATLKTIDAITAIKEALAQQNQFNPDWDAMAVMVEEQQRMAKRIAELETQPDVDRRSTESKETFDQQEPVAWLITDENINSIQIASIQRLIDRARHAHMTDIKLRINGQDEWHQADWLKHLTRTTPPSNSMNSIKSSNTLDAHRKPLSDEEIAVIAAASGGLASDFVVSVARAIEAAHGIKE